MRTRALHWIFAPSSGWYDRSPCYDTQKSSLKRWSSNSWSIFHDCITISRTSAWHFWLFCFGSCNICCFCYCCCHVIGDSCLSTAIKIFCSVYTQIFAIKPIQRCYQTFIYTTLLHKVLQWCWWKHSTPFRHKYWLLHHRSLHHELYHRLSLQTVTTFMTKRC